MTSDRVWHNGLLLKLRSMDCSDRIVNWFLNYLSNRRQQIVINGQSIDRAPAPAGVPFDCILGPLLFLFFYKWHCQNILGLLFDYL